jgi:ATP-binding protein involved in chromosome partitioning
VLEQVARQRERIAAGLAGVRRRVAVGSGKGGVGKSTLTLELALALAAGGRRVAVLDADLNGPSQGRLAGLGAAPLLPGPGGLVLPRGRAGVAVATLGALVPEAEAIDFDSVAQGDSHVWRATREFTFLSQLIGAVAWGELDFLFVDLPPGAERTFQYAEFLGPATAFVLVTTPSEVSRGVVARSVAALRRTRNDILGYIENMSGYHCTGCGAVRPLFPASDEIDLGLPCLGRVPFDPRLAAPDPQGLRVPEVGDGPAAEAVLAAASALVRALPEVP